MAQIINLGPVGFNPTGDYDNTRTYEKLDMVLYEGSSYVAKQTTLGQLPTNEEYWQLCAKKGDKGDTGTPDELEARVHDLERNQKKGSATGTEIDLTDAFDTRPRYLGIDAIETTQGENPSPDNPQDVETMVGYRNEFLSEMEYGSINNSTGETSGSSTTLIRTKNYIEVKPSTQYTLWNDKNYSQYTYEYDSNHNFLGYLSSNTTPPFTFSTQETTKYIKVRTIASNNENDLTSKWMLVEGTEEKPYVPYGTNYMVLDEVGKNYFDINNLIQGSTNYSILTPFIKIKNKTLTLSWNTSVGETQYNFKILEYNSNQEQIQSTMYYNLNTKKLTKQLEQDTVYVRISVYCDYAISPVTISDRFTNIQLEQGSTATSYEPYQHKQYPISLANQELLNKDNYVDKIIVDERTGQSYIDKRWGKLVLNGTENWILSGTLTNVVRFALTNVISSINNIKSFCNYFRYNNVGGYSEDAEHFYTQVNGLYIFPSKNIAQTVDELKNWLSTLYNNGNPVIVDYVLAEPQLIPIDNPNIKLLNGVNHITNSEGAEMDIVYVKDINIYLDSINVRLEALENQE